MIYERTTVNDFSTRGWARRDARQATVPCRFRQSLR